MSCAEICAQLRDYIQRTYMSSPLGPTRDWWMWVRTNLDADINPAETIAQLEEHEARLTYELSRAGALREKGYTQSHLAAVSTILSQLRPVYAALIAHERASLEQEEQALLTWAKGV